MTARKPMPPSHKKTSLPKRMNSPAIKRGPKAVPAPKLKLPAGVTIKAPYVPGQERILTPEAIAFVVGLERKFGARRLKLLAARAARQTRLDKGEKPDFLPETREIREGDWTVAKLPADLQDRRVEITGPTDQIGRAHV